MAAPEKIAGLCAVLLALTAPAHAELLTVTGGSIAVSAQAGETGYTVDTETPPPVAPNQTGLTSLSATANGTAYSSGLPPFGAYPVRTSASASVNVTNDASGGSTLDLSAQSSPQLIFEGGGTYCCGTASASDTVLFYLSAQAEVALNWHLTTSNGLINIATLTDATTGVLLYDGGVNQTANLLLPAGQYQAYVDAVTGPFHPSGSDLTITAVSTVPIPGTIWLLGSGLLGLSALRRRTRSPVAIAS
jgi:hypothetical protein